MPDYAFSYVSISASPPDLPSVSSTLSDSVSSAVKWGHTLTTPVLT